jgi:hypothetical protein
MKLKKKLITKRTKKTELTALDLRSHDPIHEIKIIYKKQIK